MSRDENRAPNDVLRNHPIRDTQEFESDIRPREARAAALPPGPIGAIVGAFAGALGGWWADKAAADPVASVTAGDDARYRTLYDESPYHLADRRYEEVRPFYLLGHIARRNPDYQQRAFDEIEEELRKGWTAELRARHGDWASVRPFAREGYGA